MLTMAHELHKFILKNFPQSAKIIVFVGTWHFKQKGLKKN